MVKKSLGLFLCFLFAISFVSATLTTVQLKTHPHHEVQISAYDPSSASFYVYDKTIGNSNQYGDFYWNFSVDEEFNLIVFIKTLAHESVISKKFKGKYEPGEEVYIELATPGFEFIETPELVEEVEEIEVDNSSEEIIPEVVEEKMEEVEGVTPITGMAVGEFFRSTTGYYVIGGVGLSIVIGIVLWLYLRKKRTKTSAPSQDIKVKKLSELKAERQEQEVENEELKRAEAELAAAQAKIDALKNKDKVEAVNKQIEAKKKELAELEKQIGGQ